MPLSPLSPQSFTVAYNSKVNVLVTFIDIFPAFNPSTTNIHPQPMRYNCIWDTGATNTVITKKVADELNLKPIGMTVVKHAGGEDNSEVFLVNIGLPNKVGFMNIKVTEGTLSGDVEVLVGMDIISQGDFAITHKDNKTTFSFRCPPIGHIDFVKQTSQPPIVAEQKIGRNDPCICGSGKKYKKCCGQ